MPARLLVSLLMASVGMATKASNYFDHDQQVTSVLPKLVYESVRVQDSRTAQADRIDTTQSDYDTVSVVEGVQPWSTSYGSQLPEGSVVAVTDRTILADFLISTTEDRSTSSLSTSTVSLTGNSSSSTVTDYDSAFQHSAIAETSTYPTSTPASDPSLLAKIPDISNGTFVMAPGFDSTVTDTSPANIYSLQNVTMGHSVIEVPGTVIRHTAPSIYVSEGTISFQSLVAGRSSSLTQPVLMSVVTVAPAVVTIVNTVTQYIVQTHYVGIGNQDDNGQRNSGRPAEVEQDDYTPVQVVAGLEKQEQYPEIVAVPVTGTDEALIPTIDVTGMPVYVSLTQSIPRRLYTSSSLVPPAITNVYPNPELNNNSIGYLRPIHTTVRSENYSLMNATATYSPSSSNDSKWLNSPGSRAMVTSRVLKMTLLPGVIGDASSDPTASGITLGSDHYSAFTAAQSAAEINDILSPAMITATYTEEATGPSTKEVIQLKSTSEGSRQDIVTPSAGDIDADIAGGTLKPSLITYITDPFPLFETLQAREFNEGDGVESTKYMGETDPTLLPTTFVTSALVESKHQRRTITRNPNRKLDRCRASHRRHATISRLSDDDYSNNRNKEHSRRELWYKSAGLKTRASARWENHKGSIRHRKTARPKGD